ncbi:autotransporter family protein [Phascolarctobacterium faecium]|uniref:autotransporter family protein n=1 Tax=Phascolarctobacterium faecium TaxID=33025 RepID=UPI003FD7D4B7
MDNKQLTRAVVLSLALAPVVTGRSYAVDAPIFYDDGGIYDYSDSVEIKELADSDKYYLSAAVGASLNGSDKTNIDFQKDLTINIDKNASFGKSQISCVFIKGGVINIDGDLKIAVDSGNVTGKRVTAVENAAEDGLVIKGDLTIDLQGGTGNSIIGVAGGADVKGSSNVYLHAVDGTKTAIGYGVHSNYGSIVARKFNGGTHNVVIDAVNGKRLNGIYQYSIPEINLINNTKVNIAITNRNNKKIGFYDTNIQGVTGIPKLEAGSQLNIKLDLDQSSTFPDDILLSALYMNDYTPAGMYIVNTLGGGATINQSYLEAGSSTIIEVSGAPLWDVEDSYGKKLGYGSVVGIGAINFLKSDGSLAVNVTSEKGVALRVDDYAVRSGKIEINGDTVITTNKGFALMSETVAFGDYQSIYDNITAGTGLPSRIDINKNGGSLVQITGDIDHRTLRDSHYTLNLDRVDSFLLGSSMKSNDKEINYPYGNLTINPKGTTDITLANGATWYMTGKSDNNADGSSIVNKLTFANQGYLDMTPSGYGGYEKLTAAELLGNNGKLLFSTDLQQSFDQKNVMADSDKLIITDKSEGTHVIDVKDASLLTKLASEGYLLLVEDQSNGDAAFVGGELKKGGIFKYKPIITDEDPIAGAYNGIPAGSKNWYLTGFEKDGITDDTEVLLDGADNSYALWRNTNDTLRKRLGDLRYRTNEQDGDGLWARYVGGKFGSGSFDGNYNLFQLGYDKADNEKSTYGFAIDRGTGKAGYSSGSSKDKLLSGSLYGTWYGEKGNYTDVVARIGQFSTDIKSYGEYADKADYKAHAYSLSVEYGKTIKVNRERGTFIEPQVQFTAGRLGSAHYTTDRGTEVYAGGMNSFIGRVGLVAGQKAKDGRSDFYIKGSLLHEFGGERDITMQAANGETLATSKDYGDTWFELGLGTNIKLSKTSQFYGDIERSFGAEIQKKWQINAGVRFEF